MERECCRGTIRSAEGWESEGKVFLSACGPVFQALIVVVFLGWIFVPIYIRAGVNTLPNTPPLHTHTRF